MLILQCMSLKLAGSLPGWQVMNSISHAALALYLRKPPVPWLPYDTSPATKTTPGGSSSSLVTRGCKDRAQQEHLQVEQVHRLVHSPQLHQQPLWQHQADLRQLQSGSGRSNSQKTAFVTDRRWNCQAPATLEHMSVSRPPGCSSACGCLMTRLQGVVSFAAGSTENTQPPPTATAASNTVPASAQQQSDCAAVEEPTPATATVVKGRRRRTQQTATSRGIAPINPVEYSRWFAKQRQQLAEQLYKEWNSQVFNGDLPDDLPIVWNPRMTKSAGAAVGSRTVLETGLVERRPDRVELSTKVVDTEYRLRATLAHEMCHIAAWVINEEFMESHGPVFWFWAALFEDRVPGIEVSQYHSWNIHMPFRWQCTNSKCKQQYHRHTRSLDPSKDCCNTCNGKLLYLGKFRRDGKLLDEAGSNPFNNFVKTHFAAVKKSMPADALIEDIMSRLAADYKLQTTAADGQPLGKGTQQQRGQQQEAAVEQVETADTEHDSIDLLSTEKCSEPGQQDGEEGLTIIPNQA